MRSSPPALYCRHSSKSICGRLIPIRVKARRAFCRVELRLSLKVAQYFSRAPYDRRVRPWVGAYTQSFRPGARGFSSLDPVSRHGAIAIRWRAAASAGPTGGFSVTRVERDLPMPGIARREGAHGLSWGEVAPVDSRSYWDAPKGAG